MYYMQCHKVIFDPNKPKQNQIGIDHCYERKFSFQACLLACFSFLLRTEGSFSPNLDSCIMTHLGLNAESRRKTQGIYPLVVHLIHFFKVLRRYVGNVDCNGNQVLPLKTCFAQDSIQLLQSFLCLLPGTGRHLGKISAKALRPEHPTVNDVFRHTPRLDARRSDRWWKLACWWCLFRCYFGDEGAEDCTAEECRSSSGHCILTAAHGCSLPNFTTAPTLQEARSLARAVCLRIVPIASHVLAS